ncbi:MAG: Uma2 family endonuclease [Sandaracinaceae bacterium]|nr:Uma2 family endonuclease [Sandaracinaceae bacterium]
MSRGGASASRARGECARSRSCPTGSAEIVSPSNAAHDRVTKRRLYAAHGVARYWIVDPVARTVEAMALAGGRWVDAGSFGDEERARIPPFDAIELELAPLFPPRG